MNPQGSVLILLVHFGISVPVPDQVRWRHLIDNHRTHFVPRPPFAWPNMAKFSCFTKPIGEDMNMDALFDVLQIAGKAQRRVSFTTEALGSSREGQHGIFHCFLLFELFECVVF